MTGYNIVNLNNMIGILSEERIKDILSSFSCDLNTDLENFLKTKSIEFAKQGIATTYLVFTSCQGETVLIGYYTIALKTFFISDKMLTSKTFRSRVSKFGSHDRNMRRYQLSAPLIAQLGKNYTNGYNKLITGDELLKLACDKISEIQRMSSGKLSYVECEDVEQLIDFYTSNGFRRISNRELGTEEQSENERKYLVQMIKYIR